MGKGFCEAERAVAHASDIILRGQVTMARAIKDLTDSLRGVKHQSKQSG